MSNRSEKTYVEDVKDSDEVLLPSSNLALIALGKDESMCYVPFTLLDDVFLYFGQGSAVKDVGKYLGQRSYYRTGSRCQLSNCIEDRLFELIQSSSLQLPVEYLTNITAGTPKVEVILIVGHRVLA